MLLFLAACGGSSEPPLSVALFVDDGSAPVLTVMQGESAEIEVADGQRLELRVNMPVAWSTDLGGAVASSKSETPTRLGVVLTRAGVTGTATTFELRSVASSAASLRITVRIAARPFAAQPLEVGEFADWEDSVGATRTYRHRTEVMRFEASGAAFVEDRSTSDGLLQRYSRLDTQHNIASLGQVHYDDSGMDYHSTCEFEPAVMAFSFPLWVGKTWQGAWNTVRCVDSIEGSGTASGLVETFEAVDVPAGRFDSLRVRLTLTTDPASAGGLQAGERLCWWAVDIGRIVRCEVRAFDAATGQLGAAVTVETLLAFGGRAAR